MKKKIYALLLSLFTYTILMCDASATTIVISDEAIANAKNGTALIRCGELTESANVGSAVAIGIKGEPVYYFLSNYHCIADDNWILSESPIYIAVGDATRAENYTPAQIIYTNAEYDFCIIKTDQPVRQVVPLTLSEEEVRLGDKIFAVGFSGESSIGEKLYADSDHIVYSHGEITNLSANVTLTNNIALDEYMTTMRLTQGYSGGPMLNVYGRVIALNNATHYDAENDRYSNSYAVKISHIIPILNSLGVEYELYSRSNPSTDIIIWIAVGVGVICVVAAVSYIVKRQMVKKPVYSSEVSYSGIEEQSEETKISITEISSINFDENSATRRYRQYRLIFDNSDRVVLLDREINDGALYRITVEKMNVADLSVNNDEMKITHVGSGCKLYILHNRDDGEIQKSTLPDDKHSVTVVIDRTHIYFGDIDYHMEIKNTNGRNI